MRSVIVAMLLFALLCTGCYTVKYVAPPGSAVSTLSEQDAVTFKKEKKIWYALWGLVPITDNTTDVIIAQNNLKKARAMSRLTFVDWVISLFTGFASIVPMTMTVEGSQ